MSGAMQQTIHGITEALRPGPKSRTGVCSLYALAAALAVLSWQAATVHFNYGGNWTALFMSGDLHPVPPQLAARTYTFRASAGYDGQFYRYVAHDPWLRADWASYYDAPRMRHYRILVPLLAWLMAAGRDQYVDTVYVGLILCWIFLGTHSLARYAVEEGHNPAWGLAFLLLPATLTSLDRMTVDVALAALCVAFLRYAKNESRGRLYLVLVLAPLVRETGALLIAAQCLYDLAGKRWRRAAGFATAILPAAVWFVYVWNRAAALAAAQAEIRTNYAIFVPRWLFHPVIGIVVKLFRPLQYRFHPWLNHAIQAADALSLCGLLALMALAVWGLRRRPWDREQWAILGFLAVALAASAPSFWGQVYNYARPFSPLIFFAAARPLRNGMLWVLAPVSLIALRVLAQMAPQAAGILRALW